MLLALNVATNYCIFLSDEMNIFFFSYIFHLLLFTVCILIYYDNYVKIKTMLKLGLFGKNNLKWALRFLLWIVYFKIREFLAILQCLQFSFFMIYYICYFMIYMIAWTRRIDLLTTSNHNLTLYRYCLACLTLMILYWNL